MSFGDNGRTDLKVGLERDLTNVRSAFKAATRGGSTTT